jgi:hypothetical protein
VFCLFAPQKPEASFPRISKLSNKLDIILKLSSGSFEFPIKPVMPQIKHQLSFGRG